jgi:hypothetical protein
MGNTINNTIYIIPSGFDKAVCAPTHPVSLT